MRPPSGEILKNDSGRSAPAAHSLTKFLLLTAVIILLSASFGWAREKKRDLILTPLYDETSSNKEMKTGFGYACLISGTEKTILFDIGHSDALKNMDKLKIKPALIDALVISHDHMDHTGGLHAFTERYQDAKIFDVPNSSVEICRNVFTTGAMGPRAGESNPFIQGIQENALILKTSKGLVILTGCAHPGIVEMVQKAKAMFPKEAVYLISGGFHLSNESRGSAKRIADQLKKENVRKVSPGHCTGYAAEAAFREVFGDDFIPQHVGKSIIIESAF